MKHLGDITKISGYTAPIVDCIIGGSPCQDLSVAGKRAGLDGERSGLYIEQVRIVKEMRKQDELNGRSGVDIRPRYMVWENVPGAFSSNKGEDFRVVLEELAKVKDENAVIPMPDKGKWTNSGCIMGNGWSIAWRVLDAQFWGVPQRRRRIALVADFGGESAPEILFVRKSMSGYSDESEPKRKEAPSDASRGIGADDRAGAVCYGIDGYNGDITGDKSSTLGVNCGMSTGRNGVCINVTDTHILDDQGGSVMRVRTDGKAPTIRAQMGGHPPVVMIPNSAEGLDAYNQTLTGDKANTLNTFDLGKTRANELVVAIDRAFFNQGKNALYEPQTYEDGTNPTIVAKGPSAVCYGINGEKAGTLDASYYKGCGMREGKERDVVAVAVDCRNGTEAEVAGALQSGASHSLNCNNIVSTRYIVRRLTPLECERLQGYPDGWTDIGEWTDTNGKRRQTSDAARYKALGNSIALPPWKWVLKRLCACYERNATMASLFDGIGGFPYLWEQLNGKGSCLWASEIEEFPIAVTKVRIGE